MILLADDNHLVDCKKLSKSDLRCGDLATIEEYFENELDLYDCDVHYVCFYDTIPYASKFCIDIEDIENRPSWVTHIFWTYK